MFWVSTAQTVVAQMPPPPGGQQPAISPEVLKALGELVKAAAGSGARGAGLSAEYLKAIADLIGAVAWPIAAMVFVVLFRKQLIAFIGGVESVKVFGAEIFLKVKRELDQSAKEAADATGLSSAPSEREVSRAAIVETLLSGSDIDIVRKQAMELATEYDRTRHSMPPGDERTRQMEIVVSKMRTIGRAFFPLRHEFASSASPGQRLMTIAALQVEPDYDMLDWAADRIGSEKPFVGYHALVALLSAARGPSAKLQLSAIEAAVRRARQYEGAIGRDTDRRRILESIESSLKELKA